MFNLIVFIGPSGSGKTTLQQMLKAEKIITWTSRPKREDEVDGREYHFTSEEQIMRMHEEGKLLEYTRYNGNTYATSLDCVQQLIEKNGLASIVLDANGVKALKERYNDKILIIGVKAPYTECHQNMLRRNDDDISKRLSLYKQEINNVMELSDIILSNYYENWPKTKTLMQIIKQGMI